MSFYCQHGQVVGRCSKNVAPCGYAPSGGSMGYVPPPPPVRLNLDRHGMPRDFATYMWVTYKRRVTDDSPARRAFLNRGPWPNFGLQGLPDPDPLLMGYENR